MTSPEFSRRNPPTDPTAGPRRLLLVSATIGEGHNATAAAVAERARALWPDCEIRQVDTLDAMGRLTGPAFRWIYRVNVDRTPWLYDFFYRQLWRRPWFAAASCQFTGVWAGLALRRVLTEFRPDLVVSTYPLGTGGLDWLRRRGGVNVPVAAFISDFAPHPFWVYPGVDLHYVASEPSLRAMLRARPDARGLVGAPPVVSAFRPADAAAKAAARAKLDLPAEAPVALISCGSLGFGSVERAVDATLAADPSVCAVVACGRNEPLRRRLAARGERPDRLVALGWTDRMPELTAAADVVITNAGGATALEAMAVGRAVLLFEPIAGHGKANAALMEQAGLGWVCPDSAALTSALGELVRRPELLAAAERRAAEHTARFDLTAEVAALAGLPRHHGSRPLAASDALFVGAATPSVPQQVGALVLLDLASDPVRAEEIAAGLRERFTERIGELPLLRRRLWLRPSRRPRWVAVTDVDVDPTVHIEAREVPTGGWAAAVEEFFNRPVPEDAPPWRMQVLREAEAADGSSATRLAVLITLHHSLGDGLAVTATLMAMLVDPWAPTPRPATPAGTNGTALVEAIPANRTAPTETNGITGGERNGATPANGSVRGARNPTAPLEANGARRTGRPTPTLSDRFTGLVRLGRGLAALATAGRATVARPRPSSPHREYALADLPAPRVRAVARALGTSTTSVLLGVLAEALHRHGAPVPTRDGRLRTVVPLTTRRVRRGCFGRDDPGWEIPGNDTAAVMLDLPVGPMPARQRIAEVAEAMNRLGGVQSVASQFAVSALGRLPGGLHARLARFVYGGRFFSLIASVMPGTRRRPRVFGRGVDMVYPVVPLADGVGLAVGFLSWGEVLGVGITADQALFTGAEGLAEAVVRVVDELADAVVSRTSPTAGRV